MKKVLVAPDSFKGSLTANEVCQAVTKAIQSVLPEVQVDEVPMADGGEGTVEALVYNTDGQIIQCQVLGPLRRPRVATYGILGNGKTAVMEMAEASGITCLSEDERDPMETTTIGVGEMIIDAMNKGCQEVLIGIGGSATNDAGMGMLCGLGYEFYDKDGVALNGCGKNLLKIHSISEENKDQRLENLNIIVACDVNNPLTGPNGATYTYGPQKGGTPNTLRLLEEGMKNFSLKVKEYIHKEVDQVPGAGAAGGLGAGLMAFLDATLESGFQMVSEAIQLEEMVKDGGYDLIITGEGQINHQTLHGKLPYGIARLGEKYQIPVIGIVGALGEGYEPMLQSGMTSVFSIMNRPMSLETAMREAETLLIDTVKRVIRLYVGEV